MPPTLHIDVQEVPELIPEHHALDDGRSFVTLTMGGADARVTLYFADRESAYTWLMQGATNLSVMRARGDALAGDQLTR